ncbi:hypothetical protein N9J88_04915 [Porticoccaceae bacterium]|nr:hypothetical protein [Porticoccaceae bacterium]
MVYTIPMLAATSFLATNLYGSPIVTRRVDDDEGVEGIDSQDVETVDLLDAN